MCLSIQQDFCAAAILSLRPGLIPIRHMKRRAPTFQDVAEDVVREAEERVRLGENAPTLVRDYKQRLRAYAGPFLGTIKVDDIDARKLREFRSWLAEKGLKPATINPILSFVSVVLKRAEEDGQLTYRPVVTRRGHKDCPRPAFTPEQYKALLSFLRQAEKGAPRIEVRGHVLDWEMRSMVTFMTNSFTRPGDLFVLKNKHVDIRKAENGERYLRLDFPASKNHTAPVITMPAAVPIYERALQRHRADGFGGPDDYVFLPERKNRTYAKEVVRRLFNEALRQAGLKTNSKGEEYTMYSLRHSAIMFRLLNAKDLDTLTLARNCRTSVEMIDRFYAKPLTAEMNREKLHSFRRPSRYASAYAQ